MFAACTAITGDLGRTIAIAVEGERAKVVEEGDTITLSAQAIDATGEPVPDAIIVWEVLDGSAGFDLDGTTGIVQAEFPGSGRVRARVDDLRSDTISVQVTGAPDSIAAVGDTVITMAADADVSPPLTTTLIDLTTDSALAQPLADKQVSFAVVEPAPGTPETQGFFLTVNDTVPGLTPHAIVATTGGTSQAYVVVQRVEGFSLPDSAFVDAVAVTAVGDVVAGSPVRFVVVFESEP